MSQWKQVQQLEMRLLEQVDYLYDDNFPMDIRQGLAGWIESQDWDSAVNDESMASVLFTNLQTQLEKVRSQEQNFLQRHNMKIIQQQLQVTASNNAGFVSDIGAANWMSLQGALEQSLQNSVAFERQKNMDNRVSIIRNSVQVLMDQAVKNIEDMQDDFDFCYKTLQSRGERRSSRVWTAGRKQNIRDDQTGNNSPAGDAQQAGLQTEGQQSHEDWKRRQQIAAIGGPLLTGLEQLQSWFTLTAQSLFQIKRQLDKLGELVVKVTYESDPIPLQKPQMEERVKFLIYHLIKR
uniref:Signal transducer and activator of transcription 4-like n=1 Tax=Poecilia reticulata TaxID=8081 RepID=A0A3P9NH25_POERE